MAGQTHLVLLRPLGAQGSDLTSHTLFGATCWALAALGEDVGALLDGFAATPRFAFSAPFPYLRRRDAPPLLLLPRPLSRVAGRAPTEQAPTDEELLAAYDLRKRVQQAAYISQGVAEHLRQGTWPLGELLAQVQAENVVLVGGALLLPDEVDAVWGRRATPALPWKRHLITRNSVDRMAGATVAGLLFQQEERLFNPQKAGLWFGVWADDAYWDTLQGAFRYLADTGLGGNRSVGKGHFDFEIEDWAAAFSPLATPAAHKRFINLSHYIPETPAESVPKCYALDVIRQKAENRYPTGRQRVYVAALRAFAPGGIFEAPTTGAHYGRLEKLDTVGTRTVYYSGLTLPLWGAWEVQDA